MRKSTKILVAGFVLTSVVTGCGDFLSGPKLTTDPNKQQETRTPDQYFVPIQANTWFLNEGQMARLAAVWHQQMAGVQRQFSSYDVYTVGEADLEGEWASFYTGGGIIDARKLQDQVAKLGDRRYLGIAKIYEAWLIGTMADVWGDVPYTEAVKDVATPKLDKQMDIYASVETLLASAITDLSAGVGAGPGAADLVYGGNASKWIDFAHTLRARYYLHQAEVDPSSYARALAEAQLGIKKGNDYLAFHSSLPAESNQWYQFQVVDRSGYMLAGEALVDTLKNRNDPRLAQYFSPNGAGQYVGSKPGEYNDGTASDLSATRLDPAFRQPLVTWRENQLIIAEAASKTGNDGLALTALNAVRADVGLAPLAAAGTALYAAIMTEKWIEDFQKIEVFQDYNRSCYPRLIPAPGATAIPGRFLYPINERNSNPNIPAPSQQPVRNQNDPNACP
ncbi:MAG: SusD/RagB family nutrient-binding outer membrane lipoprotein [Gemmatimonadota bacterium]|nr:SusD/RagB family nutrient-binding outer membrane lipoprotein [Gemmatimonadota bacterium]